MQLSPKTRLLNRLRKVFQIPFFEKSLRRLVQGKLTTSFIGRLIPNNYQYTKGSFRKFLFYKSWMEADIHDYMGHALYFNFKDPGHDALFELAEEHQTILDVGTNIGSTMLRFLNKVGPNGFVYGFEPDPINYRSALNNLKLNKFQNYKLENIGLGTEKGELSLTVPVESNRGGNRITFDNAVANSVKVQVDSLDNFCNENDIKSIDLIKIDVEGFELKVLKGAKERLKNFKPSLFIELDDNNLIEVGDSAKELIGFLIELGYTIKHSLSKEEIDVTYDFINCHFDIIARVAES